jgi:hypothetical protein
VARKVKPRREGVGISMPLMSPFNRRPVTIPPDSTSAWIHLAIWECWMGMLISVALGLGLFLIFTSPRYIVTVSDLSGCYAPPPVTVPCERIVYRGGLLNVAFVSLCGLMLIGVACWFLWELWSAVEPKPITDDFLRLLKDSFARNWLNPLTWPWVRMAWAYGFTLAGVMLAAAITASIWFIVSLAPTRAPIGHVDTSQHFTVSP